MEQAEDFLFRLGFTDFRVRVPEGRALLQMPEEQLPLALEKRREILSVLGELFPAVALDLKPR